MAAVKSKREDRLVRDLLEIETGMMNRPCTLIDKCIFRAEGHEAVVIFYKTETEWEGTKQVQYRVAITEPGKTIATGHIVGTTTTKED